MPNHLPNPQLPTLLTCRMLHQHWAEKLARQEHDIEQLLHLLAELPTDTYQFPRHRILENAQALNRLKSIIHRLRLDTGCSGEHCAIITPESACHDPHFTNTPTDRVRMADVSESYSQLRHRCQSILSELVRLNLI